MLWFDDRSDDDDDDDDDDDGDGDGDDDGLRWVGGSIGAWGMGHQNLKLLKKIVTEGVSWRSSLMGGLLCVLRIRRLRLDIQLMKLLELVETTGVAAGPPCTRRPASWRAAPRRL